ncbi:MAG: hypothetical protein ACXAB6_07725 [Candidatus Thorarchaeota archaeon]|jgi:hypothetical protein
MKTPIESLSEPKLEPIHKGHFHNLSVSGNYARVNVRHYALGEGK